MELDVYITMGRGGEQRCEAALLMVSAHSTPVGGAQSLQVTTHLKNLCKAPTDYLYLKQQSKLFLTALEADSNTHLSFTDWLLSLKDAGLSFLSSNFQASIFHGKLELRTIWEREFWEL